jgi:hypothetical protein
MARTIAALTTATALLMALAGGPASAQDCHANVQSHFVPGMGSVTHSHAQNCDIVIPQGGGYGGLSGGADCHGSVQSHGPAVHPGGTSPHSHGGWNCAYQAAPGIGIQGPGFGIHFDID